MNEVIRVEGLKEFQKKVVAADKQFGTELRLGLNEAARIVASAAAPRVAVRSGRLRASVRALSTQREGRAVMGSAAVPYAGWWEFGGAVGRNKSVLRPRVPQGRALYPAFIAQRVQVEAVAARVLNRSADRAGL